MQVGRKPGSTYETCWTNLVLLEYNNTTSGIAFPLLYCMQISVSDTLITDFVYARFWPHATHVYEWNVSWKVLEKRIFESWKTLESWMWSLQVLESLGK